MTNKNEAILLARRLRRSMSPAETSLWQILRQRPDGYKFRRQHPLGLYVADFYCASARLIIEVDGSSHDFEERAEHDWRRDEWLRQHGYRVIRFMAGDVMRDAQAVLCSILEVAQLPLHQATPGSPPQSTALGRK